MQERENLTDRNLILYGKGGLAQEVLYYCKPYKMMMMDEADVEQVLADPTKTLLKTHSFIFCFAKPEGKQRIFNTQVKTGLIKLGRVLSFGMVFNARIGEGSFVAPCSIITNNVIIGIGVTINYQVSIGHDTVIGNFSSIHPGANIAGNCRIGSRVLIGSNACIKEKTTIGDDVVIGMGAAVCKDILEPGTYMGNPCRRLA